MTNEASPNWILEIMKIGVPVVLGTVVWSIQSLAQRAWGEFERRRELYLEVVRSVDILLNSGSSEDRKRYLRAVRSVWIGGSDGVVKASNKLAIAVKSNKSDVDTSAAYQELILEMRVDLQTRRWFPPGKTHLKSADFIVEQPE